MEQASMPRTALQNQAEPSSPASEIQPVSRISGASLMDDLTSRIEPTHDIDFLHEIGSRMAAADSLDSILQRILDFIADLVRCDSCLVYVLEGEQLMLGASKNPHPDLLHRLGLSMGQGITGWVAEHRQTVAISSHASTLSLIHISEP